MTVAEELDGVAGVEVLVDMERISVVTSPAGEVECPRLGDRHLDGGITDVAEVGGVNASRDQLAGIRRTWEQRETGMRPA